MNKGAVFGGLGLLVLISRLCHINILWIEEGYPSAAAVQLLFGGIPYRDFWFDKPPLFPAVYLLWGGFTGLPLRLAGTLFVMACAWMIYKFARDWWGGREGLIAATLLVFSFVFWIPSAVMTLAPDLLMVLPHLAAVYFAWRKKPFWSGMLAGIAVCLNSKGLFVLAACLVFNPAGVLPLLAGFAIPNAAALALFGQPYIDQVWRWGYVYSANTFVGIPRREGALRTLNWLGFHSTLVAGAIWYWWKCRGEGATRGFVWLILSFIGVVAGLRFFPRYYFLLVPVMALFGARGISQMKWPAAALLLLLVPVARFAPRYAILANDLVHGRQHSWVDLAMNQDSIAASGIVIHASHPGDTLLVWGYRPDVFAYTRMQAGSLFLDSQPLTGVLADRHLMSSEPLFAALAARNRIVLQQTTPTFVVDGLGPYNPDLAITQFEDLREWLSRYTEIGRTEHSIVYKKK